MSLRSTMSSEMIAGRYQLIARIGSGGMGEVYRASDTVLGRTVAIKVLPRRMASDPGFVGRFRAEAQAAARLSHPNVVQVHDWGETEDTYFMVMEHVRGKNLREILSQRGRIDPGTALEICSQVLSALGAAHHQGIVHRDIKPENILVSVDGVVKVADFGIAKAIDDGATSGMLGTVAYASPEQAAGGDVDHRADIYSAGCVLFEMLTGDRPFRGDPAEVVRQHLEGLVPVPSGAQPDLPSTFDEIVMKATARDPDLRFASAAAMRTRIEEELKTFGDFSPVAELTYDLTSEVPAEHMQTAVPVPVKRKRRLLRWVVPVLVVAVLAGAVIYYRPGKIPVVDGERASAAIAQLRSAGLRTTTRLVYSNDAPEGVVIATDPPEGRWVATRARITVIVSRGPRLTDVPELQGHQLDAARALIEEAGLSIGTVAEKNDKAPKGTVIAQSPMPGRARRGDPVNLTVSAGPKISGVPDVRGKTLADAKTQLSSAGFEATSEEVHSDAAVGAVVSQTPAAGTQAEQGSTVHLQVSKGPAPFAMPDVRGKPCPDAKAQLEGAGLTVVVVNSAGKPAACASKVIEQDPLPGATVKKGNEATLYVA